MERYYYSTKESAWEAAKIIGKSKDKMVTDYGVDQGHGKRCYYIEVADRK